MIAIVALFYLTPTMLVVDQVLAPTTVIRHVKSTLRGNDLRLAKKILTLLPAISEHRPPSLCDVDEDLLLYEEAAAAPK